MALRLASPLSLLLLLLLALRPSGAFRLTQYNATLVLAAPPAAMGQYVSGDYWVVGPITIVSTEPAAAGGRNGFELSPRSTLAQPYDSRAAGYDAALLPQLPLTVAAGDNVLKAVSLASWPGSNPTFLSSAMIVTVVAAPPPPDAYRPAYFRKSAAAAALQFTAAQLRWDLYPSLALPAAPRCPPAPAAMCAPPPPLAAAVAQRYAMPQVDHVNGWSGAQVHPSVNMPGCHYGEAVVQAAGLAAARLLLDDANATAKAAAAHGLVQYGIDIGGIVAGGGNWAANGGWQNGRKLVLGLATLALGETDLMALTAGAAVLANETFSEDNEIWAEPGVAAPGGMLWGTLPLLEDAYWKLVVTGDGERIQADPYGFIDGGAIPGAYYDFCCVYKPWKGEALPQLLSTRLAAIMNSSGMLAFVRRRFAFGTWTQPDPCAPPTGACSDGSGRCAGWLGSPCGAAGGAGKCVLDTKDLGTLFGPKPGAPGHCIEGGKGRFPDLHGKNADAGLGAVDLVERLYAALVNGSAA